MFVVYLLLLSKNYEKHVQMTRFMKKKTQHAARNYVKIAQT